MLIWVRLRWGPLFFLFLSPPRIHLWPPPSPSAPHPESPIRTQGRRQPAIPPSVLVRRSPLRAPPFAAAVCARPPVATPSAAVRRRPRALVHRWPLRAPALPGKIRRSELEAAELEAAGEERGRREAPWDRRACSARSPARPRRHACLLRAPAAACSACAQPSALGSLLHPRAAASSVHTRRIWRERRNGE